MTKDPKRTRPITHQGPYSEQDKIRAVTTMKLHGGMATNASIEAVRKLLGRNVSTYTMKHWWDNYGDKVETADNSLAKQPVNIPQVVAETKALHLQDMQDLMSRIVDTTKDDNSIANATLQQRFVTFGILWDKIEKMSGLTPEMIQAWKLFHNECELSGFDSIEMINDYRDTLRDQRLAKARNEQSFTDIEKS